MRAAVGYVRLLSLGGDDGAGVAAADSAAPRRVAGLLRLLGDEYQKALAGRRGADRACELTATSVLLEQVAAQAPRLQPAHWPTATRPPPLQLTAALDRIAAAIRAAPTRRRCGRAHRPAAHRRSRRSSRPPTAPPSPATRTQLVEAQRLLDQALAAYRAGDPRAVYLVSDAYFLFDPLEKKLALSDAALASRTEGRFAELRGLMAQPGREREAATPGGGDRAPTSTRRAPRSRRARPAPMASPSSRRSSSCARGSRSCSSSARCWRTCARPAARRCARRFSGAPWPASLASAADGVRAGADLRGHRRHRRGARGRDDAARRRRCCSSSATG